MLKDRIKKIEAQLKIKLEEIRETFQQGGDKGAGVESSIRNFLQDHLPRSLEMCNGEVIDSNGNQSAQTDIVIINQDQPLFYPKQDPGLFFIEGVSAAGEVKTTLNSSHLGSALKNSIKFKKLEINEVKGSVAHINESDAKRYYKCPPWFLISFESDLSLEHIKDEIEKRTSREELDPIKIVDALFILDKGWIINFGDGEGSFKFRNVDGSNATGWVYNESDTILYDFLSWLTVVMPKPLRFSSFLINYLFVDQVGTK